MIKITWRNIATLCYVTALSLLFSTKHATTFAAEPSVASVHICSGCASCSEPAVASTHSHEHGCVDHFHRTGHPETQSKFAKPSLNKHYSFGYVGGGAAFHGEPRYSNEGTWGVDYSGILFTKRTWLSWLHGQRSSRHDGSYQTDGPHLLHR